MNNAPQQIAQKAFASTVLIVIENEIGEGCGSGSGFFMRDGLIATNQHVIDGAAAIHVRLVNQTAFYRIDSIAAQDAKRDLALLRISTLKAPPLPLSDSDRLQVSETVYAVGNPLGFEGTFSDGLISGIRMTPAGKMIQMTAPISPGSSGGPVLNARGEVVGVSTFIVQEGQNLNFAVPSNALRKMINPKIHGFDRTNDIFTQFGDVFDDLVDNLPKDRQSSAQQKPKTPARGADVQHDLSIDLFESLKGVEKTLIVKRGKETKRIRVNIPAGIESGKTLRVEGMGNPGTNGGPPGDLLVAVHVKEHPQYRREGLNIVTDLEVQSTTAIHGGKARIETLDGPVNINIPKSAQAGEKLRLVGQGVKKGRTVGDLLVNIVVKKNPQHTTPRPPPKPEPPPKQQSGPSFDDRDKDGSTRNAVEEASDSDDASGCGIAILGLIVIALAIYGVISLIRLYL